MEAAKSAEASPKASAKIPIVVGVVGHMDPAPEAEATLRASVKKLLELIHSRYQYTPIEVLSSLAEGADQIVAEVALSEDCCDFCSVRVPLPFPENVYARSPSFPTTGMGDRFRSMLEEGRVSSFVVPLPVDLEPNDPAGWEALAANPASRDICYTNAGGYIVRHSAILIALWDGGNQGQSSITEEMVLYRCKGKVPSRYPWNDWLRDGSDIGPVVTIQTPRKGRNYDKKLEPGEDRVLVPPDMEMIPRKIWERPPGSRRWFVRRLLVTLGMKDKRPSRNEFWKYREMLRGIDEFNRDIEQGGPSTADIIERGTLHLLGSGPDERPGGWPHLGRPSEFERLARIQAASDALSTSLDGNLRSYFRTLFFILFLALLFFHAYAHLFEIEGRRPVHEPIWLALFLLTLLFMAGLVAVVWYRRIDDRRLDYRAMAEALRVRYYWAMAGLTKSVAGNYLGHLEGEMSLARRTLYAVSPPPRSWKTIFDSRDAVERAECLDAVAHCWVSRQKDYYHRQHNRNHARSVCFRIGGLVSALLGWGLSFWLLMYGWALLDRHEPPGSAEVHRVGQPATTGEGRVGLSVTGADEAGGKPDARHPKDLVLILSSLLVIGGGLMIAYSERRNYDALARQYDNIHTLFERGQRRLTELLRANDLDGARGVLETLGDEALVEHVQWLVMHRIHPFEMIIEG